MSESESAGKAEERTRELRLGEERLDVPEVLPLLPVRDVVLFPGTTTTLTIGRPGSLAALEKAGPQGFLVIATQRDQATERPTLNELYPVACIARVARVVEAGRNRRTAVVVGISRTRLQPPLTLEPAVLVRIDPIGAQDAASPERDVAWERVIELSHRFIDLHEELGEDWKAFVAELPSAGFLADWIASIFPLPTDEKAALLAEPDPTVRLQRLAEPLEREVTIAETQKALRAQAESEEADPKRRERVLRKRMRAIQEELGESDAGLREVDELREKIEAANLPEEARTQADRELRRLAALPQHAPDRHLIRTYIDWLAELPWSVETQDDLDIRRAREVLDADHHDLDKVKERILEYLAVRKLAPAAKGPILFFVGPPGVGKTSLGRSIARAMGRKFARASLGGVRDEAEIRGHRRTYVGAMPGRILQSLRRASSRNPVFVLDEIDKLGADFRGDPSSALLEVLDPEQNWSFSDHYIEVPFDLSRVLFIATGNALGAIPPALLDRMEVIELPGYTDHDKLVIARRHLVPKQLADHGLDERRVAFGEDAIDKVVHEYTREAGVRNLDRNIASLVRKAARQIAESGGEGAVRVDAAFVDKALGAPPHLPETAERMTVPGVAVALARTNHGGDILFIEATANPGGEGVRLRLTGQLGDVMRESAEAALSWVRANAGALGLDTPALRNGEIHLHVPAGAVPKDGPSAGIALVTALVSVLSGRRVRGTVAMTGELSLRGIVLPVGGVKDKVLAASRAGIETVILPRRNEKDLVDIPAEVREKLALETVETIDEVLAIALEPAPETSSSH